MSKVMIKQQHLNDIADAIRYLNGKNTVRYKPREMAQAINELVQGSNNSHTYRVTINQSPHQTIYVRKYLPDYRFTHYDGFTCSEPYYYIDVTIEADEGYVAGTLNHSGTMILDRDYIIEATPATEV